MYVLHCLFIVHYFSLPLQVDKVRVGVISYSGVVNVALNLSSDLTTVQGAIWQQVLVTVQVGTLTGEALKEARTMLLADQPDRVKSVLVITDGASTNVSDTIRESRKVS